MCWAEFITSKQLSQQRTTPLLSAGYLANALKVKGTITRAQSVQLDGICSLVETMLTKDWQDRPNMERCVEWLYTLGLQMPSYESA